MAGSSLSGLVNEQSTWFLLVYVQKSGYSKNSARYALERSSWDCFARAEITFNSVFSVIYFSFAVKILFILTYKKSCDAIILRSQFSLITMALTKSE